MNAPVYDAVVLSVLMIAAFLATTTFALAVMTPVESPAKRLARYARHTTRRTSPGVDVEETSLRERVLAPLAASIAALVARTAPRRQYEAVASELIMAGSHVSPTAFLGVRLAMTFGVPILAVAYVLTKAQVGQVDVIDWVVLLLAVFWGRRLPTVWLKRRIKARQRAIDRGLPYSLDLMVACLEGGLSLDAALVKVVEQSDGPLASEIRRTLQEMVLGRPSAEAIRDLGERTGAPDLKRLTEDIVQADRMGISIAESLRSLARESRIQRRQAAEELARKAPIKMVPVLIFCVLPALGIVTMAPAAILLIRTLSQAGS
jgi:tight adherence protein C